MILRHEWRAGMRAVHEQAAGMVEIRMLRQSDLMQTALLALYGSREAQQMCQAIADTDRIIAKAARRRRMLCGACPRPLRPREYSYFFAIPAREDASKCISFAICDRCGETDVALKARAVEVLKRLWPDAREVTISHPGGGSA